MKQKFVSFNKNLVAAQNSRRKQYEKIDTFDFVLAFFYGIGRLR